jgi:hypothetical protein
VNQEGAQHPALSEIQFGVPEVLPVHDAATIRKPAMAPRTTEAASPFLSKWDGTVPAGFYRRPIPTEKGIAAGELEWHEESKRPRPRAALNRTKVGLN